MLTQQKSTASESQARDATVTIPVPSRAPLKGDVGKSSQDGGASSSHGFSTDASRQAIADATRFRQDMRRAIRESMDMGAEEVIRRSIEDDAELKVIVFSLGFLVPVWPTGGGWR